MLKFALIFIFASTVAAESENEGWQVVLETLIGIVGLILISLVFYYFTYKNPCCCVGAQKSMADSEASPILTSIGLGKDIVIARSAQGLEVNRRPPSSDGKKVEPAVPEKADSFKPAVPERAESCLNPSQINIDPEDFNEEKSPI